MADEVMRWLSDEVELWRRYRKVRIIGTGRWGTVVEAVDTLLGRTAAIRICTRSPGDIGAGRREALLQAVGQVSHPTLVGIWDMAAEARSTVLVHEHCVNPTLGDWRRAGKAWSPVDALEVCDRLLAALAFLASHQAVHGHVRPSNVHVASDASEVKLVDFGISSIIEAERDAQGDRSLRASAVAPEYSAQEDDTDDDKWNGHRDMWSVGVILYEMLTGAPPFTGSRADIRRLIAAGVPLPSSRRPSLDRRIDEICAHALAARQGDRYRSAHEFLEAVRWAR